MRNTFLIVGLFCLSFCSVNLRAQSDTVLSNAIYATTYGVSNNKPLVDNIGVVILSEGENYIVIDKFLEPNSGELFRDVYNIWAFRYKNEYYIHLATIGGMDGLKQFVKIEKEQLLNSYMLFTIGLKSPVSQRSMGKEISAGLAFGLLGGPIGAGVGTGILVENNSKLLKSGQFWLDKNNEEIYIYYIDLEKSLTPKTEILSKSKLKRLNRKDKELAKRIDRKEVSFEEAIGLLEKLNE